MRLSAREAEVLGLALEGWNNRQIAKRIGLAEKTVEVYIEHIAEKADDGSSERAGTGWRRIVRGLIADGHLTWAKPLVVYRIERIETSWLPSDGVT